MIEMHSKYDNMHINGMFMPYFALIIMYYHVKIACYQYACDKGDRKFTINSYTNIRGNLISWQLQK